MKRISTGRTSSLVSTTGGEQGFWPSYADMMSAVALILFFLMLISYIQNLITGNNLQNTQEVLEDTQNKLQITLVQVSEAEDELAKIAIDLNQAKLTLTEKEAEISSKDDEIAAMDAAISDQVALIGEQEEYMKAANKELLEMRSQMQTIAVLRLSILEQIRDSLVKVVGNDTKVSISDNGNIVLSESILFDVGSSDVKEDAIPALEQLSKVFSEFLAQSENAKYVDSIVISGHTDSTGSDEENRILSTDRANSVLNLLMSGNNGSLQRYSQYFCAAGYGESRPAASNNTEAGKAANRRIEISITLKDDTVMEIIESYLDLEVPETQTTGTGNAGGSASSTAAAGTSGGYGRS